MTVTFKGPIFKGTRQLIKKAMIEAASRIALEVEDAAKIDYLSKRKTDKAPSMIFDSFYYSITTANINQVIAYVFAGGEKAPYAKYVDGGSTYKNGTVFGGYHFMEAGMKAGQLVADKITQEEIDKII